MNDQQSIALLQKYYGIGEILIDSVFSINTGIKRETLVNNLRKPTQNGKFQSEDGKQSIQDYFGNKDNRPSRYSSAGDFIKNLANHTRSANPPKKQYSLPEYHIDINMDLTNATDEDLKNFVDFLFDHVDLDNCEGVTWPPSTPSSAGSSSKSTSSSASSAGSDWQADLKNKKAQIDEFKAHATDGAFYYSLLEGEFKENPEKVLTNTVPGNITDTLGYVELLLSYCEILFGQSKEEYKKMGPAKLKVELLYAERLLDQAARKLPVLPKSVGHTKQDNLLHLLQAQSLRLKIESGVISCSTEEGKKYYEELCKKYLGQVPNENNMGQRRYDEKTDHVNHMFDEDKSIFTTQILIPINEDDLPQDRRIIPTAVDIFDSVKALSCRPEEIEMYFLQLLYSGRRVVLQMNQLLDNKWILRLLLRPEFRNLMLNGQIVTSGFTYDNQDYSHPRTYLLNNMLKKENFNSSLPIFKGEYGLNNRTVFWDGLNSQKKWNDIKGRLQFDDDNLWQEAEIYYEAYGYVVDDHSIYCPDMVERYHQKNARNNPPVEKIFFGYLSDIGDGEELKKLLGRNEQDGVFKTRSAFSQYLKDIRRQGKLPNHEYSVLESLFSRAYTDQINLKTGCAVLHVENGAFKMAGKTVDSDVDSREIKERCIVTRALAQYTGPLKLDQEQQEIAKWELAQEYCGRYQKEIVAKGFEKAAESVGASVDPATGLTIDLTLETSEKKQISIRPTEQAGLSRNDLTQSAINCEVNNKSFTR